MQRSNRPRIFTLLKTLLIVVVMGGVIYFYRGAVWNFLQDLLNRFAPCSQPITYSIGTFDARFGISKEDFLNAIGQAKQTWETPIRKQLFALTNDGSLKINLVYDQRQDATLKLQQAGIVVHDDQASYDKLKAEYTPLLRTYRTQKAAYDLAVSTFNQQNQAYAKEVARLNAHGGASRTDYNRLQQTGAELDAQAAKLDQQRETLNRIVDTLNSMVETLNRLITTLNLGVDTYNTIGASLGDEFEEGVYTNDAQGAQITVYQYDDYAKLIRVLAHELGHALGLEHLENPEAVMYRLNIGSNEKLTTDDLTALRNWCRIQQ